MPFDLTGVGIAVLVFAVCDANLLSAFVCSLEEQGEG